MYARVYVWPSVKPNQWQKLCLNIRVITSRYLMLCRHHKWRGWAGRVYRLKWVCFLPDLHLKLEVSSVLVSDQSLPQSGLGPIPAPRW
jgi:hypothetical protein